MVKFGSEVIKGCKPSLRYQRYVDRTIRKYFSDYDIGPVLVYTAPLLKITNATQKQVEEGRVWVDAGCYGLAGLNENDEQIIILDRGTCVFHPVLGKTTSLHEIIHFAIGLDKGHGKQFRNEIRRIASLGALDYLI